jgi:hypothetical protein
LCQNPDREDSPLVRRILLVLVGLALLACAALFAAGSGWLGRHEGPGDVATTRLPQEVRAERRATRRSASAGVGAPEAKQVLFGDLHVHTTFSLDAFLFSLPLLAGEGAHPPADACDFARFCSGLDFWSINDHAEGITPAHWSETVRSIRECNAAAGPADDPDVVAYLGWEWTQVGTSPENHYGHKNVVLLHTDDENIPTRPIAMRPPPDAPTRQLAGGSVLGGALFALLNRDERTLSFNTYTQERLAVPSCPDDVPVRELPTDCLESAATPGRLFEKLRDWGHPAIVIPHGTTWGYYTPPGSSWDKQLSAENHDPELQTLVEVFSGHGNSEEYRSWRAVEFDAEGAPRCPTPSRHYEPACWRAGEIIRERCHDAGESEAECEERAGTARRNYVQAGVAGHFAVPGATGADWLDAGQCRDCYLPSFNHRPASSAQYMLALGRFDGGPERFRFGLMASSDNHKARPGTGYKELDRRAMSESLGPLSGSRNPLNPPAAEPLAESVPVDVDALPGFGFGETERVGSYLSTGGLIAVHAPARDRQSIWDAMQRREVYGTSGDHILLWFDLLNGPAGEVPMGSEVALDRAPTFRVRAVGARKQLPGCPDWSEAALTPERLESVCRGECFHPSDERKLVTRIEVVRIRPQVRPDEPIDDLIDDPWLTRTCRADPAGCEIRFSDPEYAGLGREALYYVRAIQEPTDTVNGANLRCQRRSDGSCRSTELCGLTPGDCLAPAEERAWSSPIFLVPPR